MEPGDPGFNSCGHRSPTSFPLGASVCLSAKWGSNSCFVLFSVGCWEGKTGSDTRSSPTLVPVLHPVRSERAPSPPWELTFNPHPGPGMFPPPCVPVGCHFQDQQVKTGSLPRPFHLVAESLLSNSIARRPAAEATPGPSSVSALDARGMRTASGRGALGSAHRDRHLSQNPRHPHDNPVLGRHGHYPHLKMGAKAQDGQ